MNDDLRTIERKSIREHIESLSVSRYKIRAEIPWFPIKTVEWDGEKFNLQGNFFNRLKLRARIAFYNLREKFDHEIFNRVLTKLILHLDKHGEKWLRRAAKGDTFLGKVIFGFLDVSAIPNFHEILKAVNKQYPNASASEKAKLVIQKVDWTRTAAGVAFAVAVAMGWVTPDKLAGLF